MYCKLSRISPAEITSLVDADELPDSLWEGTPGQQLDLDKNWDLLTFVLSGLDFEEDEVDEVPPPTLLGFLQDTRVGTPTGPDQTYGPPRLLSVEQVDAVCTELDALTDALVEERLGSRKILGLYPIGGRYDGESLVPTDRQEIGAALAELRAFLASCRADRTALLVWLY